MGIGPKRAIVGFVTATLIAPTKTLRAVVYLRISHDKTGEAAGVGRQREDCLAYCAERGWTVVAELTDNDVSASRYSRKVRKGYREALRMVEAGEADALVAWHLDRLYRQNVELEHLIDLAEHKGVLVATLSGDHDLMTADGRFTARILVSVAAKSSEDSSRRILRKLAANAREGKAHGGWRWFGYEDAETVLHEDGSVLVTPANTRVRPEEAALIRAAAVEVLAGETCSAIARRWNAAGVATPQPAQAARRGPARDGDDSPPQWFGSSVRALLMTPHLAGLRVHQGEVVVGVAGSWPAILDVPTHHRLVALLGDPARRKTNPPRRSLLGGLVRCGRCGSSMNRNKTRKEQVWRCVARVGSDACGRLNVTALPLEAIVAEAVIAAVDTPALAQLRALHDRSDEADALEADRDAAQARLREMAVDFADGKITRAEYLAIRARVDERVQAADAALARLTGTTVLAGWAEPGSLRASWDGLSVVRRHAIISAVVERVTVQPATHKGPVFDVSRVDITWRV